MNANELMTGDLVRIKDLKDPIKRLVCVDEYLGKVDFLDGKELFTTSVGNVLPIPLTGEILENNGFKKFNFEDIEGHHKWTWWCDTQTFTSLWCRELKDDTKGGWMLRIESPFTSTRTKIEYVHELQHALRLCWIKKEITI